MAQEVWFKVSDAPVTMGVVASNGCTLVIPATPLRVGLDTRRTSDTQMAHMDC